MTLLLSSNGKLGLKNGKLAIKGPAGTDCCCEPVTCCEGELIFTRTGPPAVTGSILLMEVLVNDVGCFPVGSTDELSDVISPDIWDSSPGFMGNTAWRNVNIACDGSNNSLAMSWGNEPGCPLVDSSPTGLYTWDLVSSQCGPLEFVFEYFVDERGEGATCKACDGTVGNDGQLFGTIRVKVTIKP